MIRNRNRIKHFLRLIRSRWQDYNGLLGAKDLESINTWVSQNTLLGFNGNVLRVKLLEAIIRIYNATHFIETGTYHGATTIFVRRYLNIPVLTCELCLQNYLISKLVTLGMEGVKVYYSDSIIFLRRIINGKINDLKPERPLFYLDAHEGINPHSLPLLEELDIILNLPSFVILIDDFKVPFDENFFWGTYGYISLNIDLIREGLLKKGITKCFFPNYLANIETGYKSGYVLIWRSKKMDESYKSDPFLSNIIQEYYL